MLESHSKVMHAHTATNSSTNSNKPSTAARPVHTPSRTPAFLYLAYNGVHSANWADPLEVPDKCVNVIFAEVSSLALLSRGMV
jgi:hypothetical protein